MPTNHAKHRANELPNDPVRWSEEIRDCVAQANLSLAVKRLIDFVREFCDDTNLEDSVYLISMNYHQLERDVLMDTLDSGAVRIARNQVAMKILGMLRLATQQIKNG